MRRPDWVPAGIELDRPSTARMYDYLLGGSHNFAVDRHLAEQIVATMPDVPARAREHREFLRRAVEYVAAAGVTQFLDIGSGIPTRGNTHEVARRALPTARAVYVDIDPVAVAHSRAVLGADRYAAAFQADARRPQDILNSPELHAVLDLNQPVALLFVAVLHFIGDADEAYGAVAGLAGALAPGSFLVISHLTGETRHRELAWVQELSQRSDGPLRTPRCRERILGFFQGFPLVEPGLVCATRWWPPGTGDPEAGAPIGPAQSIVYTGVARKP